MRGFVKTLWANVMFALFVRPFVRCGITMDTPPCYDIGY
jgi:hypothetical protein